MQPEWVIRRDFMPADLAPALRAHGLDGSVAVQARQTLEETRWLLRLTDGSPGVLGVVGWVDLRTPRVEEELAEFTAHPKFVGVRHVVQDEPDDRFMLRKDFQRGIGKLRAFGLTYDILIFPRQLPAALELVRSFPDQPFVVDHLAKPQVRDRIISPWREQMRELAASRNVMCKVSGLVTEARWHAWQADNFRAYLDVVFEAFGVDRLMYGSDWPVALLAANYEQVYTLVADYAARCGTGADKKIFGLNAARFYEL